jgi:transcriptional regulator with XRE-family HTH domain
MSTFSQNLVFFREQAELSQREVAEKLSTEREPVKVARYQAWEEERAFPPAHLLVRICDVFEYRDIYSMLTQNIRNLVEKKAG